MSYLTVAMSTDALMGLIYKAKTENWPMMGEAWKVIDELKKKFMPVKTNMCIAICHPSVDG